MLRTLHSDTKINILNPNLDVKMFIKGVQTYLEYHIYISVLLTVAMSICSVVTCLKMKL